MSTKLTPEQVTAIISALQKDRAGNLGNLEYYLKKILANQAVDFEIDGTVIEVDYQTAWKIISDWGSTEEANLPVGESGSIRVLAERLLNHIQVNIIGLDTRSSASYYQILEQAKHPLPPSTPVTPSPVSNLEKTLLLRRQMVDAYNAKFLGKLQNELEKTRYLQKITDPHTRSLIAAMLAANSANFRIYREDFPEKINQLLLHQAGRGEINNAIHLAYAESGTDDLGEVTTKIDETIKAIYKGDETAYSQDVENFRAISRLSPSIGDIESIVNAIMPTAPAIEKAALVKSLRSTILTSARGKHVDGRSLIAQAFQQAGYQAEASSIFVERIAPYLEEVEINARHELLDTNIFTKDPRQLATLNLAISLGIDPSIPWMREKDLKSVSDKLLPGSFANPELISVELQKELAKGSHGDILRISQLKNLYDKSTQYRHFTKELDSNPILAAQAFINKATGNWSAIRHPIDKITTKVWAGIEKIDDVITWPARTAYNTWEKLGKKLTITRKLKNGHVLSIPLLNPVGFIYNQWTGLQKRVALGVFKWSSNIIRSNSTKWYVGIFRQVSDFSRAFYKSDANWSHAGYLFVEKKWGNILNWSSQRLFNKSWGEAKIAFAEAAWAGFNKLAPGLAAKMSSGAIGKLVGTFLAGELTAGTSILIQAGLMAVGSVFKGIIRFFKDAKFRSDFLNRIPLIIGAGFSAILAFPAIALTFITGAIPALLGFLAASLSSLVALFSQAFLWVGVGILSVFLILSVGKLGSQIDSGPATILTDIICNLTTGEAPNKSSNPHLAAGKCIAQLLTQFGINPLTSGNAVGAAFASFTKALGNAGAAAAAQRSATSYSVYQCVGFDVTVDIMTGGSGSGFGDAKTLLSSPPSGYRPVFGVSGCSPGDFFVDTSGEFGHTGIFVSNAGPYIKCMDANGGGPGLVRDDSSCVWPTSRIVGCLKKN